MSDIKTYEYIWLDGFKPEPSMRSKIKATTEDSAPEWSFDGSSTEQAEGSSSDCLLLPVQTYDNPTFSDYLVMCQVHAADHTVHPSNTRAAAEAVVTDDWWFGFEQEYFFTNKDGSPLGWEEGEPRPQGDYYCGRNIGENVSREHLNACIDAGLSICGTNAEVMLGQWEYQIGAGRAVDMSDDLWVARWLLERICEKHGLSVSLYPKPIEGDWNGAGCHTNFSTKEMRQDGGR